MMLPALALCAVAQQPAIDATLAAKYFQHAKTLAAIDNGKLWGTTLEGPMLFADQATHQVVANMADSAGVLKKQGDVYVGKLPEEINISNTGIDWSGQRWTMVVWPLPDLNYTRGRLLVHESFHRIQPVLGFNIKDLPSSHLDEVNGRTWMRLEMRALSEALIRSKTSRLSAIRDVLLFRNLRQQLCGTAAMESERQLELNEGLSEYTGYKLCGLPSEAVAGRVALRLDQEQSSSSLSRSFCYATGAAYGLLLDEANPDWRKSAVKGKPLDELLAEAVKFSSPADLESNAMTFSSAYDGDRVIAQEKEKDEARQQRLAEFKTKFIDGPTVSITPGEQFSFNFNPNAVSGFAPHGSVYSGARVTDAWGVLESTGDVLFLRNEAGLITGVRVAALKSDSPPTAGEGWTLKLNSGWILKAADRPGDWIVVKA